MNELVKVFENEEFGNVRIVEDGSKLLFCGSDVAKALGYSRPNEAITAHCRCTVKRSIPHPQSAEKEIDMVFISEGDIYRLVARSKLPSAEKFESWIFDELLPTIRKTGGYVNNDDLFISTYLPFADDNTKLLFKSTLDVINKQNEVIEVMTPKANYFDVLVERNLLTNIRDTAKELHIKQNKFTSWLEENKYIYRDGRGDIKPRAEYTPELFQLKEFANGNYVGVQTLVTPKGRETFKLLYTAQ